MIRRRLRTLTLWTGTLLCVLIAAAFVASGWWRANLRLPGSCQVSVAGGAVIVWTNRLTANRIGRWPFGLSSWNGWSTEALSYSPVSANMNKEVHIIQFPLYALFLAAAIPTLLVWRFWPKPPKPGHCRCGYDLRGNESGVCPECGRGVGEAA